MRSEVWFVRAGEVPYAPARECQKRIEEARHDDAVPDVLLLLEHPPVYTRGKRTTPDELPMGEDWYRAQGIEVEDTDRGGKVTYHGPGQLVGYPIMSLHPYRDDVHDYVCRMERAMIAALGDHGVSAGLIDGLTGVWTLPREESADLAAAVASGESRKIGSIGVHVNRGITTHGFAVNVNNDLQPFEWVVPCGIGGCRMTSVCRERGESIEMDAFVASTVERFGETYDRRPVEVSVEELAAAVPGLEPLARVQTPA